MTWEIVPNRSEGGPKANAGLWWLLMAVGLLVSLVGLALLVWPFTAASWLLVVLLGSALIANGLGLLVRARFSGAAFFAGALLILFGVLAIVFSDITISALVTFAGVASVSLGLLWTVVNVSLGAARSWPLMLPPVLLIVAGVVALVWPGVALVFVAVVAGLLTLLVGATLIWSSLAMRRFLLGGSRP